MCRKEFSCLVCLPFLFRVDKLLAFWCLKSFFMKVEEELENVKTQLQDCAGVIQFVCQIVMEVMLLLFDLCI